MKKVSFKKILNVFTLLEFNNIFKNFKTNVSVVCLNVLTFYLDRDLSFRLENYVTQTTFKTEHIFFISFQKINC